MPLDSTQIHLETAERELDGKQRALDAAEQELRCETVLRESLGRELATERQARETAEAALKRMREPVTHKEVTHINSERIRWNEDVSYDTAMKYALSEWLAARASEPETGEAKRCTCRSHTNDSLLTEVSATCPIHGTGEAK